MRITRPIAALVVVAGLTAGACTTSGTSPGSSTATTPSAASPSVSSSALAASLVIRTATSAQFGTYLVGPNGMALYTHAGDTATSSTCTGTCAKNWPPLTAAAGQVASPGAGITGTFGTITRDDGSTQVTYNGMPLYYWIQDKGPGDVTGNGINGFAVAIAGGVATTPSPAASSTFSY